MTRGGSLLLVLGISSCPRPDITDPVDAAGQPPGHITILHTNDLHSHFLPAPAEWIDQRPAIGGFVRLDAEIDAIRLARGASTTLLIDGGDILSGTPLSDVVADGAKGGAMVRFLEALDYDAWVIGNHEFDKGLDNLSALTAASDVPVLSANLRATDGVAPLLPRQELSRIFTVNGVRVGVIGVTTDELAGLMNKTDFARLVLQEVGPAVKAQIAELDGSTDLLVVLSHIGVDADMALARGVPGIDLIVGGHSHTRITEPRKVENTWIVQAGSYNRCLGVLDLVVENDALTSVRYELRDLLPGTIPGPPSPEVEALVAGYSAELDALYKVEVSTAPAALLRSSRGSSPLGRWATAMLRQATGADVGLYNGSGLRAELDAGPVTTGDLFNVFPFGNEVVVGQLTGDEVMGIVLGNSISEAFGKRSFMQISGVTWTWRMSRGAPEIVEAKVGGAPLDPKKLYTVATNSFVAEQWDRYLGAALRDARGLGYTDYDAAVTVAKTGPVKDSEEIPATRLADGG